jgi:hypothetical protein
VPVRDLPVSIPNTLRISHSLNSQPSIVISGALRRDGSSPARRGSRDTHARVRLPVAFHVKRGRVSTTRS